MTSTDSALPIAIGNTVYCAILLPEQSCNQYLPGYEYDVRCAMNFGWLALKAHKQNRKMAESDLVCDDEQWLIYICKTHMSKM